MPKRNTLVPLKGKIAILDKSYQALESFIKKRLFGFTVYDGEKAKKLKAEINEKIARQDKINRVWAGLNIPLAYNRAASVAKDRLVKIGARVKKKRFDLVSSQSKKNGALRLVSYMDATNEKIRDTVTQYFKLLKKSHKKTAALQNLQLQNLVDNQEILKGTEEIIKASIIPVERVTKTGFSYLATPSRLEVQRDIKKLFGKVFGDFDFISITMKNGKVRNYKPNVYMKMLTRTEMRTIQTQAVKDRSREYQNDLVQISTHDDPCPICEAFEGQIYSLSGNDPTYPKFDISFPIHPNCEHNTNPTSKEAIAIEKEHGKVFPKPYRGSVQDRIDQVRKSKLKIPTGTISNSKEAIIQRLKDAGIKNVSIDRITDIKVLKEIESQLISLGKDYRPIAALRARTNGAYAWSQLGGISLNTKWFNDYNKILTHLSNDIAAKFHPIRIPKSEAIKSVLTHEFAHDLTVRELQRKTGIYSDINKIRRAYRKKLREMKKALEAEIFKIKHKGKLDKYIANWKRERDQIYISEYAAKDIHEFTAEAFTDYKHSPNPSPFSVEVGKLIDAKYKTGGKK